MQPDGPSGHPLIGPTVIGQSDLAKSMNQADLTALFRKLGAEDPAGWARSQIAEGIPQLARYLFLRQAWRNVVSEDDPSWINDEIADGVKRPGDPYAGVGKALARLRDLGAADDDIVDVVRGMQAGLLFNLCYLLDDPGDVEPEVEDVCWRLVQTDDDDNVLGIINGLHESVFEVDPTGREMRPRPDAG